MTRIGIAVTPSDEALTSSNESSEAMQLLSPASFATCSGSTIDRSCWVRDIHKDEGTEVFVMHADGGVLCLLCNKHKTQGRGKSSLSYAEKPAYPARPNRLKAHLNSDMHKLAVEMDQLMQQSTFHALHLDRVDHKTITVAQRVQLIYWVLKEEIALRKVVSLQSLFNKIGLNYRLSDFQHTSSTSVSEFVALISQHLTDKIVYSLKKAGFWASMVDETTDIATLQQYITFVRYVEEGEIKVSFLDIRRIDANGATAKNLYKYWQDVADIYSLDQEKHIAMSVDGCAAMLGKNNSLTQRIQLANPYMLPVHCYAHRLALSCADTCKDLQTIQACERGLVQTWRFFAASPLKSQQLALHQQAYSTNGKRLIKACRTRWLSYDKAVSAMKAEIIPVWSTLQYYGEEKKDALAVGLLRMIRTKQFVRSLYLLGEALPSLGALSLLFQGGHLHFPHITTSLQQCKKAIADIQTQQTPYSALQADWQKFEFELGPLTDDDSSNMQVLATHYCEALLANLDDRFPEPHVLSAFQIFDPLRVPHDAAERNDYGVASLNVLLAKFGPRIGDQGTTLNAYQLLKDHMIGAPFHHCKDAGDVCKPISKDSFYTRLSPEL